MKFLLHRSHGKNEGRNTHEQTDSHTRRRTLRFVSAVLFTAILLALLIAPAVASAAPKNHVQLPVLTGQVTGANALPVCGAQVKVLSGTTVVAMTWTGRNGQYRVFVPEGTYDVSFGRCDYATTTDLGVGVVGPTFTLDATLVQLPGAHPTGDRGHALPVCGAQVKVVEWHHRGRHDLDGPHGQYRVSSRRGPMT